MCGFVGILDLTGNKRPDPNLADVMAEMIRHRGPDDRGSFSDRRLALEFRRLAIIDLATGHQPLFDSEKNSRYAIVFNGEIYNFQEIKKTLEGLGHRFQTKSDTEVILRLFMQKGPDCLKELRGMFALAIWDSQKQRLFLARDRLGKKPLYWSVLDGQFCFASEIKALWRHPGFDASLNPHALDLYLTYQYIASPQTIYEKVKRLPPACWMYVDAQKGVHEPQRYWQLSFTHKFQGSYAEAQDQIRHLLEEATRLRLISEVPLGAFLSGGIDSSAVVAMMARHSTQPVKTFSIGFEEEDFSELPYAKKVAQTFGCDHHEMIVKPNMMEVLPKILWHYDQPFADPSALPTYYVSRETRRLVTVALNGDGGDEAFGGYLRYLADFWASALHHRLPQSWKNNAGLFFNKAGLPKSKFLQRLLRFSQALGHDLIETNFNLFAYFKDQERQALYAPDWTFPWQSQGNDMRRLFNEARAETALDKIFWVDYQGYLPECLLVKMDVASMAHSLEARSPFLDHEVVEFAASLPVGWKLGPWQTKKILRSAFKNTLPKKITGRGKMGFGIPVNEWFRGPLGKTLKTLLLEPAPARRPYFNSETIRQLLAQHRAGGAQHGLRLWALLCFEIWHRLYIDKSLKPGDQLP